MTASATSTVHTGRYPLARALAHAQWEARRVLRRFGQRFGWVGWVIMAASVVAVSALVMQHNAARVADDLHQRLALAHQNVKLREASAPAGGDRDAIHESRQRLASFEQLLLPPSEIPEVLKDLLRLAAEEELDMLRGEYQPQIDQAGGFMRYRMNLPLKGESLAIYRFMAIALRDHPSLALESVRFVRGEVDSAEVEARIQWVLLTRLPGQGADSPPAPTELAP